MKKRNVYRHGLKQFGIYSSACCLLAFLTTVGTITPAFSAVHRIPIDLSQEEKPPTVKVLIKTHVDRMLLEAKGGYNVYDPETQVLLTSGLLRKKQWLTLHSDGIKWGEVFPGIFQMRIVPADNASSFLIDGIEYKGCVEIYASKGELHLVNEVDIERYLKSTLGAEFPNELDEEVMDAIAITARTNAYFLFSRHTNRPWHISAQEIGYQGHALTLQNVHVDRAINNTRHMVLTYQGTPFAATWVKNCAGTTTDYATVYRRDIRVPQGVQAPFAAREREQHQWSFTLTRHELAQALQVTQIHAFDLYQDRQSHKVYGARIKEGSEVVQLDFFKLQKALGSSRLKSNDFTIQTQGDKVIFKGFGEGCGVGLCLFSANAMADKGDKAPKILSTFFPQTQLQNIRSLANR